MNVVRHVVGPLAENAYILAAEDSSECAVIDPGADAPRILNDIRGAGLDVRYILVTHGHADHTGAVAPVKTATNALFGAHGGDAEQIRHPLPWITAMIPDFAQPPPIDWTLADGDQLELGSELVEVIATPGHTPGSVCYRIADAIFTGDTLFKGSIGRYDLPGGDGQLEIASIRKRLLVLPDETRVLPGHGSYSTIGEERTRNRFLTEA